jgi:hypothetical protein
VSEEKAQAASAAAPEPAEDTVTLTTKQLNERMERAVRSFLKRELGAESADEIKAARGKLADLERAEEERRKAAMSEQEKLQAELAEARKAADAASAAAEQARVDLHLTRLFARHGVKNPDYATWRIMDKLNQLPESEELDEEAYLRELLSDQRERVALGVETPAEAAPRKVEVPPTTTAPAGSAPKPPPANPVQPPKTAMDMSPAEWARHKSALGIS